MKIYLSILIGFILVVFTRCSGDEEYKVSVEFDSTFPAWVVDDVEYDCDGAIPDEPKQLFDSTDMRYHTFWDSAPGGVYTVNLKTIFLLTQTSSFDVSSDTILKVKNELNLSPVDSFTLADLVNADTVEFVHISSGCFNYNVAKTILFKQSDGYKILRTGLGPTPHNWKTDKPEGEKMLGEIISMQHGMRTFRRENDGLLISSTSTQTFFIRADRRIFMFHDEALNWTGYEAFERDSTAL